MASKKKNTQVTITPQMQDEFNRYANVINGNVGNSTYAKMSDAEFTSMYNQAQSQTKSYSKMSDDEFNTLYNQAKTNSETSQNNTIPTLNDLISNPQIKSKEDTYKTDYSQAISDLQTALNGNSLTDGERNAYNEFLGGLNTLKGEIDAHNNPTPKTSLKQSQKAISNKKESSTDKARKLGEEALKKAQNDSLQTHGYSLSPNEQRDYERAQTAIAQAQEKAKVKGEKTEAKNIVASTDTQTKSELQTNTLKKNYPNIDFDNLPNVEFGERDKARAELAERNVRDTERKEKLDKYLDPDYKLSKEEKKDAKALYNEWLETDYKNPNVYSLSDDEKEMSQRMDDLAQKTSTAYALLNGVFSTPEAILGSVLGKTELGKDINESTTQNRKQNPVTYEVGKALAGAYTAIIGGEFISGIPILGKIKSAIGGNLGERVASYVGDRALDVVIDDIPNALRDVQSGMEGTELAKDIGLNATGNTIGNALGNIGIPYLGDLISKKGAKAVTNAVTDTIDEPIANGIEQAVKNTDVAENIVKQADEIPSETVENIVKQNNIETPNKVNNALNDVTENNIPITEQPKTEIPKTADDITSPNVNKTMVANTEQYSNDIVSMRGKKAQISEENLKKYTTPDSSGSFIGGSDLSRAFAERGYDIMENGGNNDIMDAFSELTDAHSHGLRDKDITADSLAQAFDELYLSSENDVGSWKNVWSDILDRAEELDAQKGVKYKESGRIAYPVTNSSGKVVRYDDYYTAPKTQTSGNDIPNVEPTAEEIGKEIPNVEEPTNPINETLEQEFPTRQTAEMRARQNAKDASQKVTPNEVPEFDDTDDKQYLRETLAALNMSDEKRAKLSSRLDEVDSLTDEILNCKTEDELLDAFNRLEDVYEDVTKEMKDGVTVPMSVDMNVNAEKKAFKDALQGRKIVLPKEWQSEIPDSTLKELNNSLFMGTGSARFVRGKQTGISTIDSTFEEIDNALGGALSRYMEHNGLDTSVPQNQMKGLVEYADYLKTTDKAVTGEVKYEGEMLFDHFQKLLNQSSERLNTIQGNSEKLNQYVSKFRTHKQGVFGLTDEQLESPTFNTQNENFIFTHHTDAQAEKNAQKLLDDDYSGTINKIIDKTDSLTKDEVFAGKLAWDKEVASGNAEGCADLMYRMAKDANERGLGLQSYKWLKKETPMGVVLDANQNVHQMAKDKFKKKDEVINYVDAIDSLTEKIKNVCNNSDLTFEEQAKEIQQMMKDLQSRYGFHNGVNGFDEMKKLLETGKEFKETIIEDLNKAGRSITEEDFNKMIREGLSYKDIADDLKKVGSTITEKDFYNMLKTGKNVDAVTIKDILYAANKIPNIDADGQLKIANLAQEMFGKELTEEEKIKYINAINVVLSQQQNWTIKDKANEIAHIMMLSGTKTHLKNVLANIGMLPQQKLANKISALGQDVYHLFNPDYKPTQAIFVSKQSKNVAEEVFNNAGGADAIVEGVTGKYNGNLSHKLGANYMFTYKKDGAKNIVSKINDKLTNSIPVLKNVEEKTSNLLNKGFEKIGADGAYSTMDSNLPLVENFRQFIYESMSSLEDNPFVKKNFTDRLASYIQARGITDVAEVPQEAIDIARAEALKATFKDDNATTELFRSIKKRPIVGEALLPFAKTLANLYERSIDFSPVGIAKALYGMVNKNSRYAKATIGESFDDLSKGISGSLFGLLGMYLYANGVITGKENEDKDIANFMKSEGWRAYAVSASGLADFINDKLGTNLDLGDNYYTFSWLQPSTTNIIASEELYDELTDGEKLTEKSIDELYNRASSIVSSYGNSMLDQSTFQNIADMFDTSYGKTAPENLMDTVLEMPTRYFSGAINDITKLIDDNKREYYSSGKPVESAVNLAKSKMPGLSQTLPKKYDSFGNEVTRSNSKGEQVFNTLFNTSDTGIPNDEELYSYVESVNADAKQEGGKDAPQYYPNSLVRKIELKSSDEKYNLSNEEYAQISKNTGDYRKELMNKFRNSEVYKDLSAGERVAVLDDIDSLVVAMGQKSVVDDAKASDELLEDIDTYNSEGADSIISAYADNEKKNTIKTEMKDYGFSNIQDWQIETYTGDETSRNNLLKAESIAKEIYGEDKNVNETEFKEYKNETQFKDYLTKKKQLEDAGLSTKQSNIDALKNGSIEELKEETDLITKLNDLGVPGTSANKLYSHAQTVIPELTVNQFADTFSKMNTDGNSSIKQEEIFNYFYDYDVSESEAKKLWKAYGDWETIPVLENGVWKAKKQK